MSGKFGICSVEYFRSKAESHKISLREALQRVWGVFGFQFRIVLCCVIKGGALMLRLALIL